MAQYNFGDINATLASTTVTNNQASEWLTYVVAGDIFEVRGSSIEYIKIASVTSDTELELAAEWPSTTVAGADYCIHTGDFSINRNYPLMDASDDDPHKAINRFVRMIDADFPLPCNGARLFQFRTTNEGFTATNATFAYAAGTSYCTFTGVGANHYLQSPSALALDPSKDTIFTMRCKLSSGTGAGTATLLWEGTPGSGTYNKSKTLNLKYDGDWCTVSVDFIDNTDWTAPASIERFRIQFPKQTISGGETYPVWLVDYIAIGESGGVSGHVHTGWLYLGLTDGLTATYATADVFIPGSLMVMANGYPQVTPTDYSEGAAYQSVVFAAIPLSGIPIHVAYAKRV